MARQEWFDEPPVLAGRGFGKTGRHRPPRPFIAAEALIRASRAGATRPVPPDVLRCPITACDGAPLLNAAADVQYRRADLATVSANWYCPECGITVTVTDAERG